AKAVTTWSIGPCSERQDPSSGQCLASRQELKSRWDITLDEHNCRPKYKSNY
ncbi:unnamed protein product, partial [Symbiodinium pilosum]